MKTMYDYISCITYDVRDLLTPWSLFPNQPNQRREPKPTGPEQAGPGPEKSQWRVTFVCMCECRPKFMTFYHVGPVLYERILVRRKPDQRNFLRVGYFFFSIAGRLLEVVNGWHGFG